MTDIDTNKPTDEEIQIAVRVMAWGESRARAGEPHPHAYPVFRQGQATYVQPAHEGIIVNPGALETGVTHYWLTRRADNDHDFGPNRLHVMGTTSRPGPFAIPYKNVQESARKEMRVTSVRFITALTRYQWTKGVDHPYGDPISLVDVYEAISEPVEGPKVQRFHVGDYPALDDMIIKRAGLVHMAFLRVFHGWVRNRRQPFIDLNLDWPDWGN